VKTLQEVKLPEVIDELLAAAEDRLQTFYGLSGLSGKGRRMLEKALSHAENCRIKKVLETIRNETLEEGLIWEKAMQAGRERQRLFEKVERELGKGIVEDPLPPYEEAVDKGFWLVEQVLREKCGCK
jgi:hypothetical protein